MGIASNKSGMARVLLPTMALAAALIVPSTASAATSNSFSFTATGAKIAVANQQPFSLDPSQLTGAGLPALDPISMTGTIDDSGRITIPKSGAKFPSANVPVPQQLVDQLLAAAGPNLGTYSNLIKSLLSGLTIGVTIEPTGPISGTFTQASGAIALDAKLDLSVALSATIAPDAIKCTIPGVSFALRSEDATLTAGGKLAGVAYSPTTKKATLASVATVPTPKCTLSPTVSLLVGLIGGGSSIDSLISSALGGLGGSLGQVGLQLEGDVVVPPPAVVTMAAAKTVKISTKGTVTAKLSCSKARSCAGTAAIAQPGGVVIASKTYRLAAGKSTTVTITLPKSTRTLMKTTPKMEAVFRVAVTAGTDFSQSVMLQRPSNWR